MKTVRNILILAFAFAGCAALAGERVERRVEARADGTVNIENLAGSISVSAWDRNEIRVEAELDDRVERLEFSNDGNFTRIEVIYPDRLDGDVGGTHLNISVPARSSLEIGAVSSEVDVRGVTGPVRVNTLSGDISADGATREYALETVSGNIRLEGTDDDARISAVTMSGDVRLGNIKGELDVSSVSGNIYVSGGEFERIEAANISGDLDITGMFADGGTFQFEAVSGDITLHFASEPAGVFDIATVSGGIDNDFGPRPQRSGTRDMELEFRAGDSDSTFGVNTLSGDISLRKE